MISRTLLLVVAATTAACGPDQPRVALETQFGTIVVEVDSVAAPATAPWRARL